jgi:hypothetical protein
MLALLPLALQISFSVFVPVNITQRVSFETVQLDSLKDAVATHETVVACVGTSADSALIAAFVNAKTLFRQASFVVAYPRDMKEWVNQTVPERPYLVFIKSQAVTAIVGPIDDETTLLTTIDLHLTRNRPTLETDAQLLSSLNGAPTTIIGLPRQFSKAFDIAKATGATFGPANVVAISPELYESVQLQPRHCAVFRRDDLMIEPFECTLSNYKKTVRPGFFRAKPKIAKWSDHVVAVYTHQPLFNNVSQLLGALGAHFKDVKFVYFNARYAHLISDFTRETFNNSVINVVALNFTGGYYFNISHIITDELKSNTTFDGRKWHAALIQLCYQIRAKTLQKIYRSETVPPKSPGVIQKLVGSDYGETVTDASKDVFVMFTKPRCEICDKLYSMYRGIAQVVSRSDNSSLFTSIDVRLNSVEGGFPLKTVPSIVLFPKANKTDIKILIHESYDVMKWFAEKYTGKPVTHDWGKQEDIFSIKKRIARLSAKEGPEVAAILNNEFDDVKLDIIAAIGTSSNDDSL